MPFSKNPKPIRVGARDSNLSKAQVAEVFSAFTPFHPNDLFEPIWIKTTGDKDLKTPLVTLEKTDFFTKELDEMVLKGEVDIAIHSAKDLPEPLSAGLEIFALTRGVDPSDVLVLRDQETLASLGSFPVVGTSSQRREETIKQLLPHASFLQIRGSVPSRIEQLNRGDFDALVTAEAALIRLKLTHLNRLFLKGETAPFQGQLAIVGRKNDFKYKELFECLDIREKAST